MAAGLAAAREGLLEQARDPLPGAAFADAAMDAVARAIGFDGYCLFGVDPITGLRTVMFSRHGLSVSSERLVANETVEHDLNRYADLVAGRTKAGVLAATSASAPLSPRLHEILRPDGYTSELRLVLVSRGTYWGALSLFRDDARRPFTEANAEDAEALGEILSRALRRYQVGRPAPVVDGRPAGVVLFDSAGELLDVSPEARAWLVSLAESGANGATEDDVSRVVLEVAAAVTGASNGPALCRVRMPAGDWLVVSGTQVRSDAVGVAVILRAGDIGTVTPAFAAWCGLSAREAQVLDLMGEGIPTKQMARRLSLAPSTVEDHLEATYRKAGVRGRDELFALLR
jgi:DNA-binding CsgD family transcriptional regulator